MTKIFISYRRSEAEYVVGRIYEELCDFYGENSIFKDIYSISLGVDFRKEISTALQSTNILLAVVGNDWGIIEDEKGNIRINNKNDYVRFEIEEALSMKIPVIPVFIKNAQLPDTDLLPDSLKPLTYLNSISIRADPDFINDIDKLKKGIDVFSKKSIVFEELPEEYIYIKLFDKQTGKIYRLKVLENVLVAEIKHEIFENLGMLEFLRYKYRGYFTSTTLYNETKKEVLEPFDSIKGNGINEDDVITAHIHIQGV